jgi:hypothetical protein
MYNSPKLISGISQPECNAIYHQLDTNRSGLITFDEFAAGLKKFQWDINQIKKENSQRKKTQFEWEIPYSEIQVGSKLGEGTYGVVFAGKWRGTAVAVKKLKGDALKTESVLQDFRKELNMLAYEFFHIFP